MELLIALIPAMPLAGFLFAVLVGPRLDHVPHHDADHGTDDHGADAAHGADDAHGVHDLDDSAFRTIPTLSLIHI